MDFRLDGRLALITGSTRGLGLAIAKAMGEQGARVIINSRTDADCQATVEMLSGLGHDATALVFDAADVPGRQAALARLDGGAGSIDILVNNAGIIHRAPLAEFPEERWRSVLDVNLTAPFLLAQQVAPGMIERGWGRIINISSILGQIGRATIPAYVSSKHGLIGLTRTLAVELGPHGVTVNAINPGYFATEFNAPLIADETFDTMVKTRTPLGRWGEPVELAGAAVFLASDAGGYVNGAALTVDGGMTAAL
ncbi:MAG: 3-oxoacyl-ACP reductase FabG [Rhodospirillaceae bacterium]|jgi:gluconate 5-dehydrogenase|nr:3-oxoacyl-ACP reductase FabG [Rhodospirillaceae bacterium]MBT4042515.1 3-oxoacyl-ACP reductase FabG [Rhodospirillaceae bacterium]MBT4689631.1 3-oxoacyl-ACP reductase FabG [Rhodospirillaceae bacterium]MBT5083798.1 3-oxoacyl-ACP reductase FabG [Rhodospirillaceae bacterium]MBT5523005.1 3-oxoacyl-ACP reductase FabG [Rhodospirillaceae bacterium]